MKIALKKITIEQIADGYVDNNEGGVVGFGGKLNIRPPYQREFVYNDKQRNAVIGTVLKGFPLNAMYWLEREDGTYEIIDGQQRTISVCQYVKGDFSFDTFFFHSLPSDKQKQILNYELQVYVCSGATGSETLDLLHLLSIQAEKRTAQELRNIAFAGPWVSDAKRYFSKTGCPAYGLAKDYMWGSPIRQDFLEIAIDWISDGEIETYMSAHQHDPNATELWQHFQRVISWVRDTFPIVRREMRKVDWGKLFKKYGESKLDPKELEERIKKLMADSDVRNKAGIYPYVLNGDEKLLDIR